MIKEIFSQVYKHFWIMITWPGELATIFVYPLIGLLSLGLLGRFVIAGGTASETFIFIIYGVLSWNIYSVAQQTITRGFFYEMWDGCMKYLFLTKVGVKEFVFGNMLYGVIATSLVFVMMSIITAFLFGFNILSIGPLIILGMIGILLHSFSEGLIILSILIKKGRKFTNLAWVLPGIIMVLSGVYYPVSVLPAGVRHVSNLLPTTHAINGMRSLILQPEVAMNELLLSVGLGLVYFGLTFLLFRYAFHSSKKEGSLISLTP